MKVSGTHFAILAAIFVGASIVVGAEATKQVNPILVAALTMLISVVFLIPLSYIVKEKLVLGDIIRKYLKNSSASILLRSLFGNILLYTGLSLTSAVNAVFLLGFEPAFVVITGFVLLKEKISARQISLILALIVGAFLLSTNGDPGSFGTTQFGDLIVVLAVFFMALSYIPAQEVVKKTNSTSFTIFTSMVGGLILLPISLVFFNTSPLNVSPYAIYLIIGNAVLFSVFALFCFYNALKTTKRWIVSALLQLAPIPGALVAYFWLGNVLSHIQLAGAGIILVSSYLIAKGKK